MKSNLRAIAQAISAGVDPRTAHFEATVNADKIEVGHNLVLVATAIESETTKGGIIKPDKSLQENRYQGKAALVLKLGPLAFKDQPSASVYFGGFHVKPGDWVIVRPSDGTEMFLADANGDGTSCRLFEDVFIRAKIEDPELIY